MDQEYADQYAKDAGLIKESGNIMEVMLANGNSVSFPTGEVDNVNHPSHYTQYKGIEVIDLTEQMNFNCGNAVKYICRAGFKSPESHVEDLMKARWYIDREIDRVLKEL